MRPKNTLWFLSVVVSLVVIAATLAVKPSHAGEPYNPIPLFLNDKANYPGGPFRFAIIGECKNSCAVKGEEVAHYIDQNNPDIIFSVTMGDLISYQGDESDWVDLSANLGWFMDRYATFPVLGDQERIGRPQSRYYEFYGLPQASRPDNSTWSLGNSVFLMLSYYDPPNIGGSASGRYTSPEAPVYDVETGTHTTVADVLNQATASGKHIFTFSHAQYAAGSKHYCCYSGETRDLFESSNIRVHFQSDNPGFTVGNENGIWYVRSSGVYGFDPPFYALVTVDGETVTVDFPDTDGGIKGQPIVINGQGAESFWLNIQKIGAGSGLITSAPAGVDCGSDCSELFARDTVVQLTASPDPDSVFGGWSGDPDCGDGLVTMSTDLVCFATFDLLDPGTRSLTVSKSGSGSGGITSSPEGIDCGVDCQADFAWDSSVQLNASADTGSEFLAWTGDADCSDGVVTMSQDVSCVAVFTDDTGSCQGGVRIDDWSTAPQSLYLLSEAQLGAEIYTDRSYIITSLSEGLEGGSLIQTANDDSTVGIAEHLFLTLCESATMFVAFDARAVALPIWLSQPEWTLTTESLSSEDAGASPMYIYRRDAPAGAQVLGGNRHGGGNGASSNYLVIVKPYSEIHQDGFESGDLSEW